MTVEVITINMPMTIKSTTIKLDDDNYIIAINEELNAIKRYDIIYKAIKQIKEHRSKSTKENDNSLLLTI